MRHNRTIVSALAMLFAFLGLQWLLGRLVIVDLELGNVTDWWATIGKPMAKHGPTNVWTPYPPVFPTIFYLGYRLTGEQAHKLAWL